MKQQAQKQIPVTGKKVAEAEDVTPKGEPLGGYLHNRFARANCSQ
jgi:hypothetical protein